MLLSRAVRANITASALACTNAIALDCASELLAENICMGIDIDTSFGWLLALANKKATVQPSFVY